MIEFFTPHCGYCKQLAPEYSKLAADMDGLVDVTAIDCSVPFNEPICSRYLVKGKLTGTRLSPLEHFQATRH
jgi:protein disulfide-isomerase A6